MTAHHTSRGAGLGLTFVRPATSFLFFTASQSSLRNCMERLAANCGDQDARQGWGWLSDEQGGALDQRSQQRSPGCREPELVGKENQEGN